MEPCDVAETTLCDELEGEPALKKRTPSLGTPPLDIVDLVRVENPLSFAYFEHCKITGPTTPSR